MEIGLLDNNTRNHYLTYTARLVVGSWAGLVVLLLLLLYKLLSMILAPGRLSIHESSGQATGYDPDYSYTRTSHEYRGETLGQKGRNIHNRKHHPLHMYNHLLLFHNNVL